MKASGRQKGIHTSCYTMVMVKSRSGFTIVELLIVIVVIAILAAITTITYSNIQKRARDSHRKSDLSTLAKAYGLYRIDNGDMFIGSGCGSGGNGAGWVSGTYGTYTPIHDCLKNSGVLSTNIQDPQNIMGSMGTISRAYMKYSCIQNGSLVTYFFASLESEPQSNTALDSTCQPDHDTNYGMNYYVKI